MLSHIKIECDQADSFNNLVVKIIFYVRLVRTSVTIGLNKGIYDIWSYIRMKNISLSAKNIFLQHEIHVGTHSCLNRYLVKHNPATVCTLGPPGI